MAAKTDGWIPGTEACAGNLETNREKSDPVTVLPEVPNEEVEVENVGPLEDLYADGI
jgi:hypothetical protein